MFEKVRDIIVENLDCDAEEVTLEASLTDDLNADSLDAVEIGMAFEDEFGIEIPDEDLAGFKTVKDIVDYMEKKAN